MTLRPSPIRMLDGRSRCNEPLYDSISGDLQGFCRVLVRPYGTWFRPAGTHKGPHMITWANTRKAQRCS